VYNNLSIVQHKILLTQTKVKKSSLKLPASSKTMLMLHYSICHLLSNKIPAQLHNQYNGYKMPIQYSITCATINQQFIYQ